MSARRRAGYDGVAVAVPVTVPYVRYSTRSSHWFIARALAALIQGAGVAKADVDGVCVSGFLLYPDTAVGLMQHLGLSPRWLDHIPMGGACGVVALRRAARAVQSGDAQIVACVAGDTHHVDSFRHTIASFSQFTQDAVYPYGAGGPNASFALLTDHFMRTTGARREDFGKLCVAQRTNARSYPYALLRTPLTLQEYLDARPIAEPLHLFDCVMPCAGAEGFLVMTEERARGASLPFARVLGTIERHNAFPQDPIQVRGGWALDRAALYEQAGVGPADLDVVELYDDYPVITALQLQDLGLCPAGDVVRFIRDNTFTVDGSVPLNTSGGQLSVGQAGAAGGYLALVEGLRQVTGTALGAQVANAQHALVSGFGMINYDRGLCSGAAILAGSGR